MIATAADAPKKVSAELCASSKRNHQSKKEILERTWTAMITRNSCQQALCDWVETARRLSSSRSAGRTLRMPTAEGEELRRCVRRKWRLGSRARRRSESETEAGQTTSFSTNTNKRPSSEQRTTGNPSTNNAENCRESSVCSANAFLDVDRLISRF